MVKILFIIAQQNFRDEELEKPKKILESENIEVKIASIEKKEALGMLGLRIIPDLEVREVNPNDFDGLVIVGGSGCPKLAEYPEVMNLIKRFNEQKKLIAAICLGSYVLARAGILRGRKVTVFPIDFAIAEIVRNGGKYMKEKIVEDDNILTAEGPDVAEEFGRELVRLIRRFLG